MDSSIEGMDEILELPDPAEVNFVKKQNEGSKAAASTANNEASGITTVDSRSTEHNSWVRSKNVPVSVFKFDEPAPRYETSSVSIVDIHSTKPNPWPFERLNSKPTASSEVSGATTVDSHSTKRKPWPLERLNSKQTASIEASGATTLDLSLSAEHDPWPLERLNSKPTASSKASGATIVDSQSTEPYLLRTWTKRETVVKPDVQEKYEKASKSILDVIVDENERLKEDLAKLQLGCESIKGENNFLSKRLKFQSEELYQLRLENANLGRNAFVLGQTHEKVSSKDGSLISGLSNIPTSESGPTCNLTDLLALPYFLSWRPSPLKVLDLSHTSIKTLPASLTKLAALQQLILRRCELFMELPSEVGEIQNLEVLDLDGTEILELPQQIGMLSKLKILRVSFYGYMNCGKRLSQNTLVHPGTISALSQLTELSIDANPDDERWNAVVEAVIEEACSLKRLLCLILYLPNVESLGRRRIGSTSLNYYPLPGFRFIVGQHRLRGISRIPKQVEAHFQEWKKCLKFVKGKDIPSEMKKVLKWTKAFYLDRHATARSLCDFGIKNMEELEFCILVECNEIQTIMHGETYKEQPADMLEDESSNFQYGEGSHFAEERALLNLQYLHIYYLKKLVSICRTPSYNKQCLCGLKILTLDKCPKLSIIFSPVLLRNFGKLEVLLVKDCPEVTSVVNQSVLSIDEFANSLEVYFLSLQKISLLYLPKLVSISSGFQIAPKLEKIGFYNCPKLESLSAREMSSGDLKVIRGESKWWEALTWNTVEYCGTHLDYLQSIFSPITRERDVMTQMEEM